MGQKRVSSIRPNTGAQGRGRDGIVRQVLPLTFRINDECVAALIEHVIGDRQFSGDLGAVETAIAENLQVRCVAGVDYGAAKLGAACRGVESALRCGFDDELLESLILRRGTSKGRVPGLSGFGAATVAWRWSLRLRR